MIQKGASQRTLHLWVGLAVWGFTVIVSFTGPWRSVEYRGFDWLSVLRPPGAGGSPIAVIGIDEPSFAELGLQWPWPRDVHGRLVDRLKDAGAAVIAFDVVFAEPSTTSPAADADFAEAIKRAGNIILGADEAVVQNAYVSQRLRIDPLPLLIAAGAQSGSVAVTVDADSVIRRLPTGENTFWRKIFEVYAKRHAITLPNIAIGGRGFIRYVGPDHSFPYVSYYQALEPESFLPKGFFKDRVVLIGLDVKASPEPGVRQADMFATPFLAHTERLMPGVEVQANILDSVIRGRVVQEVPRPIALLFAAIIGLASAWGMRAWQPLRSAAVGLALAAGVALIAGILFQYFNIWLPMMFLLLGIGLLYVSEGGLAFLREQALRRRIKQAFSHYVPPHVVEEMIAHPERLVLGGDRRELTITFADLAGFTTLSEQLSPEQVVQVLNRYLTEVTRVVVQNGGTVDKFIGDAIMAFWGAPLDDADHAFHACQAAEEMQAAVARLRTEFAQAGRPLIYMRIGIHSGIAVVGNMGSETLFDYTAVGDDVNLASRLEGVNKIYGTDVLISEATARYLRDRIGVRRVDKVRVKGKTQPVEIFTLQKDSEIQKHSEEAIHAYRERRWDDAELLWRQVLRLLPEDGIATVYLERIDRCRQNPPPEGWDGSVVLEQK